MNCFGVIFAAAKVRDFFNLYIFKSNEKNSRTNEMVTSFKKYFLRFTQ